ncbi:unnamed protein product [Paramecium primaurelia]|uniref:LITAF domain-containing protein n=1 Tax=Paramecium primaurelia TaxID=5886 RepID=A0A8S1N216_PARPR|nr:unnamed protein product [Paramecium primaurelia]
MQNNQHVQLQQEMTPTPSEGSISQVVYPSIQNQQIQIGQPIQQQIPAQQIIHQVPYQQSPYSQNEQPIYNPQQPIQIIQPIYSKYPSIITCVYCQRQVQTVVNYEPGTGTYVVGGILAAVGLWLGCCLIPCFIQDCKDAVHFCPSCQANVGKKRFIFD